MGKLLILAAIAGGMYYGYKTYFVKSEAFMAYEKFATAMQAGRCPDMTAWAEGAARAYVDELCAPRTMTVYGKTFNTGSAATMIQEMNETPSAAMSRNVREIESEKKSSDGKEVSLQVIDSVAGRSSAMNPLRGPIRHIVKLQKSGEAWKVIEFAQEDVKQ